MRTSLYICIFAVLACLLLAAFECYPVSDSPDSAQFQVSQTSFDFNLEPLGKHLIVTTITNPSNKERRIIGMEGQCRGLNCIKPLRDTPLNVAAFGAVDIECEVLLGRPGPIDIEIKLYLEENGIRTVTLRVTGTAVEGPRAPK